MNAPDRTGMPLLRTRRPDEMLALDNLATLVPITTLQRMQESFSPLIGMPLVFVSTDGSPITRSSGLETFCSQFTRKVNASRPCVSCGRPSEQITEIGSASVHACPLGLQDITAPLWVNDQVIAYLATTQMTTEPEPKQMIEVLRKQGMDESAAASYMSRIPVTTQERIVSIAEGLSSLADVISQLTSSARQNLVLTTSDPLTGVTNRARFWECLANELEIADTHNYPVSVLLLDLDDFKMINDHYGHQTGDDALRAVGDVLKSEIRTSDLTARYGSDSFLVMLRGADPSGAEIVAWRLKNKIADCELTVRGQKVALSASVGHVTYPICAARDPDALFKEALAALNAARQLNDLSTARKAA